MKVEDVFIGAAICGLALILALPFVTESATNYKVSYDNASFVAMTQSSVDLYELQSEMQQKLQGGEVSDNTALDNVISGGYLGIRSLISSVGLVGDMATSVFSEFAFVHPLIVGVLLGLVGFGFFMAIIYLIFRVIG